MGRKAESPIGESSTSTAKCRFGCDQRNSVGRVGGYLTSGLGQVSSTQQTQRNPYAAGDVVGRGTGGEEAPTLIIVPVLLLVVNEATTSRKG